MRLLIDQTPEQTVRLDSEESYFCHSQVSTFKRCRNSPRGGGCLFREHPPGLLPIRFGQYDEAMNLGFPEMMFIFFLALIIFGPKKLPEIGRQIGRALNEFKRASNEFKAQIESEINQLEVETHRQTILPPVEPPAGAIAARTAAPEPLPALESGSETKAPDA